MFEVEIQVLVCVVSSSLWRRWQVKHCCVVAGGQGTRMRRGVLERDRVPGLRLNVGWVRRGCRTHANVQQLLDDPGGVLHEHAGHIVLVKDPVVNDISSTKVRAELAQVRRRPSLTTVLVPQRCQ